ncbi:hypothetical protein GWI33_007496 [Rhynchophorus ferrugineus]|uniref:Secreted protein n=1 Tax=Rhynchophorus ferrugineus TaxID=354439 RepID=A0A834IG38_RHYFE|nr:hypothetical protein GWI33_007496 [Rhynchophorus ferrugineus]
MKLLRANVLWLVRGLICNEIRLISGVSGSGNKTDANRETHKAPCLTSKSLPQKGRPLEYNFKKSRYKMHDYGTSPVEGHGFETGPRLD